MADTPTFAKVISKFAQAQPDKVILIFENGDYPDEPLTYRDLKSRGDRLARALLNMGFKPGDVLGLVMRNHPEIVYATYAASAIGLALVPINPVASPDRLAYQLSDSGSKGVIYTSEFGAAMNEVLKMLPELRVVGVARKGGFPPVPEGFPDLDAITLGPEVESVPVKDVETNPFLIIYTSGTTGNPKGVEMSESRLFLYSLLTDLVWDYKEDDVLYTGLSLTHGNAWAVTLVPGLTHGLKTVISQKFTKSRIWDICRRYGCTTFSLLGGMLMGIYAESEQPDDGDNPVRKVMSAGTPASVWRDFEKRFNLTIHEWYGAVEGGFAHNPPGVGPVGSFGKALEALMEMKVVREDDTECDPGEIGELIVRNRQGTTEVIYHNNPDASAEKTRGGWLRTGDMCHRDAEGWFYFDFRQGDSLRRQGEFIIPADVEKVIARHPNVTDVCVYGIPAASDAPGESDLVAAVVFVDPVRADVNSIFRLCQEQLSGNSVPSYIQVVPEIPKTPSEKNLSRLLKNEFSPDAANVYRSEDFRASKA